MHIRRWGAAALLTMAVAACSKPVPGPATLPPLTPPASPTVVGTKSATETPKSPTPSPSSTATTSAPPQATPTVTELPPSGDSSEAAAVATAVIALKTFDQAENALDMGPARKIAVPTCNCLDQLIHAILTLESKKLHRVGAPPVHITSKVLARDKYVVRVQLTYDISPFKFVSANGKIVERVDFGHLSEIDQMNYVNGHWRVFYVTYNA